MNTVIDKVVRLSERDILLNFLDQLDKIIYNLNIDVKSYILENTPFHAGEEMLGCFGSIVETRDADEFSDKIKELKKELLELHSVKLTLPFEPSGEFASSLSKIVREEFKKPVIFEFEKNDSILAGAVIEGESRVGKYTLSQYFDDRNGKEANGI